MPVTWFYECTKGHITEKTFKTPDEAHGKHRCRFDLGNRFCNAMSQITYMSYRKGRNALAFKPIEFFTDGKEIINLGYSINDLGSMPSKLQKKAKKYISKLERKGFQRKEINSLRQYEQFRRDYSAILTSEHLDEIAKSTQGYDEWIHKEADDLRRGFVMTRADGSTVQIPPLSHFDHPEVAQLARDLMENKPVDLSILDRASSSKAQEIREANQQMKSRFRDAGFHIRILE